MNRNSAKREVIPITSWNSPSKSISNSVDFSDGGFEEYWNKMELLGKVNELPISPRYPIIFIS